DPVLIMNSSARRQHHTPAIRQDHPRQAKTPVRPTPGPSPACPPDPSTDRGGLMLVLPIVTDPTDTQPRPAPVSPQPTITEPTQPQQPAGRPAPAGPSSTAGAGPGTVGRRAPRCADEPATARAHTGGLVICAKTGRSLRTALAGGGLDG